MNTKKARRLAVGVLVCGLNGSACANIPVEDVLSPKGNDTALVKDVVHAEGNDTAIVKDVLHLQQTGNETALADVDLKAVLRDLVRVIDQSYQAKTEQENKPNAGRDAYNISPVFNVKGGALWLGLIAAVGLLGLAGHRWVRVRKMLSVVIRVIEALPAEDAEQIKSRIAKRAYSAGISQAMFNAVQGEVKRALTEQKSMVSGPVKSGS